MDFDNKVPLTEGALGGERWTVYLKTKNSGGQP